MKKKVRIYIGDINQREWAVYDMQDSHDAQQAKVIDITTDGTSVCIFFKAGSKKLYSGYPFEYSEYPASPSPE